MAPRLTTAALALVGATVLAVVSTVAATDGTSIASAAGRSGWMIPGCLSLAGLACLVLGLAIADSRPIGPALALLGAAWLVAAPNSDAWHALTAVAGGWLLAVAELAYWSLDFKLAGRDPRAVHMRRGASVAVLVGASVVLAMVPELNVSLPTAGVELTVAGLLAAAALIAVAASLAWRLRPPNRPAGTRG
jgi:hypothetical protein